MAEAEEQTPASEVEGQSETRQVQIGSRVVVNTDPKISLYDGMFGEIAEVRINHKGEYYLVSTKDSGRRPFAPKDILMTEPLKEGEELKIGTNVVVDGEIPLYNGTRGIVKAIIPGGYRVAYVGDTETRNFPTKDLMKTYPVAPLLPKASQSTK